MNGNVNRNYRLRLLMLYQGEKYKNHSFRTRLCKGRRGHVGPEPHRRQERDTAVITGYLREKRNEGVLDDT